MTESEIADALRRVARLVARQHHRATPRRLAIVAANAALRREFNLLPHETAELIVIAMIAQCAHDEQTARDTLIANFIDQTREEFGSAVRFF